MPLYQLYILHQPRGLQLRVVQPLPDLYDHDRRPRLLRIIKFGGYGVRARSEVEATKLIADAQALEKAGCFAVVLEKIPASVAQQVTDLLSVPTIGIGAGSHCDGHRCCLTAVSDISLSLQAVLPQNLLASAHSVCSLK